MTCFRRLLPWVTLALFSFLVVLSLSAGLTRDYPVARWGPFRRAAFMFGAAGLLGAACLQLIRVLDKHAIARSRILEGTGFEVETRSPSSQAKAVPVEALMPSLARPNRRWVSLLTTIFVVMIIGVTYVGLASVWHWTEWPATTAGYAMLADAITQGKTYLDIDPASADINLSYFKGRYYWYFGPAPAVALAILRMFGAPSPGDEVVVFAAISLILLFSSLIVFRLKRVYFARLPQWLTIAGLVTVATIHPMLWFLNSADLGTAAIACGQAFLVGGAYFMVRALTETNAAPAGYAAAGALWGLAISSRLTTAAPVIVLVLGTAVLALSKAGQVHRHRTEAINLVSLIVPLVLVLGLHGWYNAIRFESPLETGWRYQIYIVRRFGSPVETGLGSPITATDKNGQIARVTAFSVRYLVPDAFYFLLAPIRPISRFPYLRPVYGSYKPFNRLLPGLGVPAVYNVDDAAGLAFAAPTLLFAIVFARKWLYGGIPHLSGNDLHVVRAGWTPVDQGSLGSLLLIGGLAGVLPVILYFFSAIRFEMDFVPLLAIVAVLGMWRLHEDTRPFPIQSRLATGAIILIVTAATLGSFLLAVSGAGSRFDDVNPSLLSFLVGFLPHW